MTAIDDDVQEFATDRPAKGGRRIRPKPVTFQDIPWAGEAPPGEFEPLPAPTSVLYVTYNGLGNTWLSRLLPKLFSPKPRLISQTFDTRYCEISDDGHLTLFTSEDMSPENLLAVFAPGVWKLIELH